MEERLASGNTGVVSAKEKVVDIWMRVAAVTVGKENEKKNV